MFAVLGAFGVVIPELPAVLCCPKRPPGVPAPPAAGLPPNNPPDAPAPPAVAPLPPNIPPDDDAPPPVFLGPPNIPPEDADDCSAWPKIPPGLLAGAADEWAPNNEGAVPVLPPKRLPPLAGVEVAGVEPKILVDVEAGVDPNKLFAGVLPEVAPNSEGVSPPELAGWPLGWPKLKDMLCWRDGDFSPLLCRQVGTCRVRPAGAVAPLRWRR